MLCVPDKGSGNSDACELGMSLAKYSSTRARVAGLVEHADMIEHADKEGNKSQVPQMKVTVHNYKPNEIV